MPVVVVDHSAAFCKAERIGAAIGDAPLLKAGVGDRDHTAERRHGKVCNRVHLVLLFVCGIS